MTPEFTHCALHVSDLDESIAFYESYCGLRIVKEHGKGKERTVWMAHAEEGAAFVLVLLGGGPEREQSKDDMTHYGFAVASRADVESCCRARQAGRAVVLGAAGISAADRLSLRRPRPQRLHRRVLLRPAAGPKRLVVGELCPSSHRGMRRSGAGTRKALARKSRQPGGSVNRANPTVRTFHAWQAGILRSNRQTRAPSSGGRLGGRHAQHHRHRAVRSHPRRRASAGGQELRPAALRPYLDQMRLGADLLAGTCHHRQQCSQS